MTNLSTSIYVIHVDSVESYKFGCFVNEISRWMKAIGKMKEEEENRQVDFLMKMELMKEF